MTRSATVLLLLAALLAPAAARASGGDDVIRDCTQNGQLTRTYSKADLNYARTHVPADAREYSDCQAIIDDAYAKASAQRPKKPARRPAPPSKRHRSAAPPSSPSSPPPASGGGHSSSSSSPKRPAPAPTFLTKSEGNALNRARATGALDLSRASVRADTARRSDTGLGALPAPLLAVLVLLVLGALAALAAGVRQRYGRRDDVLAHRA